MTTMSAGAAASRLAASMHDLGVLRHQLTIASRDQREQGDRATTVLNELSSQILDGTTALEELATIANDVDQRAHDGDSLIGALIQEIADSSAAVQANAGAIDELASIAKQIGQVANAIDQIASSTRMLALNARIEAARAGDQGAGFAVVAGEVKSLAANTAEQAGCIADMVRAIADVADRAGRSSAEMGNDNASMALRRDRAEGARQAFAEIVSGVSELTTQTTELAGSSRRQSDELKTVTSQVEQTARSAKAIERSAEAVSVWSGGLGVTAAALATATLDLAGAPTAVARALEASAEALRDLIDVPVEHASWALTIGEHAHGERGRVVLADLEQLDAVMSGNLRRYEKALCGSTVTLLANSLADSERAMYWWVHDAAGIHHHQAQLDRGTADFYDYEAADWFVEPLASNTTWYSDPYFDAGGADRDIVTLSVPFRGVLSGVATVDIALEQLAELVVPYLSSIGAPCAMVGATGHVVVGTDDYFTPHLDDLSGLLVRAKDQWIVLDGWSIARSALLPWPLMIHTA